MNKKWLLKNFLFILLLFVACFWGPLGCGGGESEDEGASDGGDPVTSDSAEDIADASIETVEAIFSLLSSGSESLSLPEESITRLSPQMRMTVTETTSCSGLTLDVNDLTSVATIYGTDFSSDGSGSCTIRGNSNNTGSFEHTIIAAVCDSFSGGSALNYVTFDGTLGMGNIESSSIGDSVTVAAAVGTVGEFLVGFIENGSTRILDLVINYGETIELTVLESSVSYTDSINGCISVGDDSFDISDYRTGSNSL